MKLVLQLIYVLSVCAFLIMPSKAASAIDYFNTGEIVIDNFDKKVKKYTPVTIDFKVDTIFQDPYDYEEVQIDAILETPLGDTIKYPSYFEENGNDFSNWKVRFTPRQIGTYQFSIKIESSNINTSTKEYTFQVTESDKNGFLQISNESNYHLRFDSGRPFRGVGQNFGWEARSFDGKDSVYNYSGYLNILSESGVNFVRTWMCPWNLPLEWKKPDSPRYEEEEKYRFNRSAIEKMDKLIRLADEKDIYMMVALDYHGALLTEPDYWGGNNYWPQNPYNKANGGYAEKPAGFFTNPEARKRYKKRLRFIMAKWGYSPHLAVLEFWNEIDNAMADENIPPNAIVDWHKEMAEYVTEIDPYNHIITTSTSHRSIPGLYEIDELDFGQAHLYGQTDRMGFIVDSMKNKVGKPVVVGEIAYDWKSPKSEQLELFRADLHRSLWEGLFSEVPILPMTWWWEFFYENDANSEFASVSRFKDRMIAKGYNEIKNVSIQTSEKVEAKGVKNGDAIYAWVRKTDQSAHNENVIIEDIEQGDYVAKWYNTRKGTFVDKTLITVSETSGLVLSLTKLKNNKDIAFEIIKK